MGWVMHGGAILEQRLRTIHYVGGRLYPPVLFENTKKNCFFWRLTTTAVSFNAEVVARMCFPNFTMVTDAKRFGVKDAAPNGRRRSTGPRLKRLNVVVFLSRSR